MTITEPWQRTAQGAQLLDEQGALATTIFAEMSALAGRTGAINLGQGFPDEDGPTEVLETARQAISDGVNQYSPGPGAPVLRQAISAHQQRFYGLEIDPDRQVLVTAGATEALAASLLAFVTDGDEVVVFEPFYDAYAAITALAGGQLKTVELPWPDFQPDHDELVATITDRTGVILVNNPHNPTGTAFDRATLELIVELAQRHNALILTDEVYEHLRFDAPHLPVATLPGAFDRTLTVSSGGKTFNTTGWKIGWLTAPAELVQAVTVVKQYLTFVNGAPLQPAIAEGLRLPDAFFTGAAENLRSKRDLLSDSLRVAGFDVAVPQGGYFVVADAEPIGFDNAMDLARTLPDLAGVVGVPVTALVHPDHHDRYASLIRFAYCKKVDVLEEAAGRLRSLR